MFNEIFRGISGAGRTTLRGGAVLVGATVLAGGVLAGVASAATGPRPSPGLVPGVSTSLDGNTISIFYRQANHNLITLSAPWASEWGRKRNLGGRLTSGPAAITIDIGFDQFANTWVFARGADEAVHYREYVDARGEWGPWTRLGSRKALGAPTVTCLGGPGGRPVVFIRGTDGALWQRSVQGGRWISRGGHLASSPAALPTVSGKCPAKLDVFALGTDHAVWEFTGSWHRVGGKSVVAPSAVRLPGGATDLFVRGTDNALWMNVRPAGASSWRGWHRIGGFLTSAPTATLWPFSSFGKSRTVLALGRYGNLRIAHNFVGSSKWTWGQVP